MSNVAQLIQQPDLNELAKQWLDAKALEGTAKNKRLDIEDKMLEQVDVPIEGVTSIVAGNMKVKLTGKVTRSLNVSALVDIKDSIPKAIMDRLVHIAPKLDLKELRYVEKNEPEIYADFSRALTIKPAKTSVTVVEA